MTVTRGHEALKALYAFYDEFAQDFPAACRPGCSTCCSVNVTATTLETSWMLKNCAPDMKKIEDAAERAHYQPAVTANRMAFFCLNRREPPDETSVHAPGRCPLLDDLGYCTIYEYRPFSCRAMFSLSACKEAGEAEMPPFLFTLNLALYQIIEHLDRQGFSGNMLDLLLFSWDKHADFPYVKTNSPLPGFMVPPDEQLRFRSLLRRISNIPLNDGSLFSELLPENLPA